MSLTRTSDGLVFQETFNPGSDWASSNWTSVNEPTFVASPRSPITCLAPSGLFAGGVRESQIYQEADGTWYHYYSGGDGTSSSSTGPWRIQYSTSTDGGLDWTHEGYTDFDLQKTDNPADGYWPCRDMLCIHRFGSTYYLDAMSGNNWPSVPQHPTAPLESDMFTGSSVTGPWTFVGRKCEATESWNDGYLTASCTVHNGGQYHFFACAFDNDTFNMELCYATGATPDALPTYGVLATTGIGSLGWRAGENPKVFWSDTLNRWAMVANGYDPTDPDTHCNLSHISTSLTDWTQMKSYVTQKPSQGADQDHGRYEVGLSSPIYVAEGLPVETEDGYVPVTYDAEPVSIADYHERINYHKIYYAVLEPSTHCMRYTPGVAGGADDFNRSNRNIHGDNGWTQPYGTFSIAIASNKLNMGSVTEDVICVQAGASAADVALEATLTLGANAAVGFIARYADSSNFLFAQFASSSSGCAIDCFKKVSGSYTNIGTISTPRRWNADDTHKGRVTFIGTKISAFLNDVLVGSVTDGSITTSAGAVGFRNCNASTNQRLVDDFSWRTLNTAVNRSALKSQSHSDFAAEMFVMLDTTDTDALVGLDYRVQASSGDSYRIALKAGTGLVLQKSTGGSGGTPGSFSTLATNSGTGDPVPTVIHRIDIRVSGNVHRVELDGELQINYTDSSSPYASGDSLALVGAIAPSQVRLLHMRESNDITINGLTIGNVVTLRAPGGIPIATATASDTTHTFTDITHFPLGSIDIDGVQAYP